MRKMNNFDINKLIKPDGSMDEKYDYSCLAEGYVVPADFELTGINQNELVVGPTGCGKTFSNAYSRLLHTRNSSLVVPLSKKALKEKFSALFRKRGYEVAELDFAHPERCEIGYDPMDFIRTDEDVLRLAQVLVGLTPENPNTHSDPFWDNTSASMIAAELALVRLNAKYAGKKPSFADFITLHRSLEPKYPASNLELTTSNLDIYFEEAAELYPGNQASALWDTIKNLPTKTYSTILATANSVIDKILTPSIIEMMKKGKKIDFKSLGEKKTILFITTSPVNKALQTIVDIMYADLFKELFEGAEEKENGRLDIPVHIICDDFACGSRIKHFEDHISIFRAAGISVTLLLQSETQLTSMYGVTAAATIINNCDTYVYMGGMDYDTCNRISIKLNRPMSSTISASLGQVVVFRRGCEPVIARRYQTLEDPEYIKL